MTFYNQYPMMRPYKGNAFSKSGAPSLLLIGESHFLDEDSPQRADAKAWYSGSSDTLTHEEIQYISTANLLKDATANNFPSPTHVIYSNPFWEINDAGPRFTDYRRVANHIAFYNFFLRPAVDGDSLRDELSVQDIEVANEAFYYHYNLLAPTAVIFLSQLAFDNCAHTITVPMIATPHPGCAWWNRTAASYGNRRGRDILAEFVKTTSWTIPSTE